MPAGPPCREGKRRPDTASGSYMGRCQAEGSHTRVIETRKIQDITDQGLEGVRATGAKSAISKQVEVGGQRHVWQDGWKRDQTQ